MLIWAVIGTNQGRRWSISSDEIEVEERPERRFRGPYVPPQPQSRSGHDYTVSSNDQPQSRGGNSTKEEMETEEDEVKSGDGKEEPIVASHNYAKAQTTSARRHGGFGGKGSFYIFFL